MEKHQQLSGFVATTLPKVLLGIGLLGLTSAGILFKYSPKLLLASYLAAYFFFLSIAMGSFFLVLIQYLTRAGWGVVVRRVPEHLMGNLAVLAILFLPILFGLHHLYPWLSPEAASDAILQIKAPYLNRPFFIVRALIYFAVWILISRLFFKKSIEQDVSGSDAITAKLQRYAAPAIIAFSLTFTFATFDWLMSLSPHWYSTIFGVCAFGNAVTSALASMVLIYYFLRRFNFLKDIVTVEHFHDLGKLMYGFIIFWTYVNFSQFMLIWYANIPEETAYFLKRSTPSWKAVALLLVFCHFVLPLFALMSRHSKRNLPIHATIAAIVLLGCYLDTYFIVAPNFSDVASYGIGDIACFLGIGGIFGAAFLYNLSKNALTPLKDPRLTESLYLENL